MANAHTLIKRIEFIIEPEVTHCNVFYSSDEPGTPWGGGWKTKTFPGSTNAIQILHTSVSEYILWADGRAGVDLNGG